MATLWTLLLVTAGATASPPALHESIGADLVLNDIFVGTAGPRLAASVDFGWGAIEGAVGAFPRRQDRDLTELTRQLVDEFKIIPNISRIHLTPRLASVVWMARSSDPVLLTRLGVTTAFGATYTVDEFEGTGLAGVDSAVANEHEWHPTLWYGVQVESWRNRVGLRARLEGSLYAERFDETQLLKQPTWIGADVVIRPTTTR